MRWPAGSIPLRVSKLPRPVATLEEESPEAARSALYASTPRNERTTDQSNDMPVDVQCPGACARADPRTVHDTKDRMRHRRRRSSSAQHQRWIRRRHARPWRVRARSATADLRSTTGDAPDRPDRSQNRAVTATERHGSKPSRNTRIHTGQNSHGKTRITRINKPRINADKHGWHLSTYPCSSVFFRG